MKEEVQHRFGLIGYPLGHSFSKGYFRAKFEQENIPASYDNYEIEDVQEFTQLRTTLGLVGLNVTIPFKQSVIPLLDQLSPEAAAVGAVNTIVLQDGVAIGYNTDIYGCAQSLLGWIDSSVIRALILGTGGAARAVSHVLKKMGIAYQFVSRNAGIDRLTYENLSLEVMRKYQLIVNTTPLGMSPKHEEYPEIPYLALTPNHYLFDLIYNPEKTLFLKLGEEQGAHILNGLKMLHLQADRAWEIWKTYLNDKHGKS